MKPLSHVIAVIIPTVQAGVAVSWLAFGRY